MRQAPEEANDSHAVAVGRTVKGEPYRAREVDMPRKAPKERTNTKKPGRSIKEKRAAKKAKQAGK